jgi:hypothetical protein
VGLIGAIVSAFDGRRIHRSFDDGVASGVTDTCGTDMIGWGQRVEFVRAEA